MRRVGAISDYLESPRKGETPGVALCGRGGDRGKPGGGGRASYGLLEGLETIRQSGQELSFRASTWQIDFVRRLFSHI